MRLYYFAGFDVGSCVTGAGGHVQGIILGLHEQGWDVTLFSCRDKKGVEQPKFPFRNIIINRPGFRWPSQLIDQIKLAFKLFLMRQPKPDVIYIRNRVTMIVPVLYALWYRIPFFYEINALKKLETRHVKLLDIAVIIENWVLKHATAVFLVTEELRLYFIQRTQLPPEKFITVHNACCKRLCEQTNNVDHQQLSSHDPTVGFTGAFQPRQGIALFLRVTAPLLQQKIPNLKVIIAGGGPEEAEYINIVQQQNIGDCVTFKGYVPEDRLAEVLDEVDIAVAPYTEELRNTPMGSPLKIYTYLACGKIVVTSDLPSLAVFSDCPSVKFARADDPHDFAETIYGLFNMPKSERQELSRKARAYILENHTWQQRAALISKITKEKCGLK